MKTRYKFLRKGLKSDNGDCIWKFGEWKHEDKLSMCNSGFHCSKRIWEAFSYVKDEILAEVEVKGKHESEEDKEVWSDMRILRAWKWQKKDSVELAIFAIHLDADPLVDDAGLEPRDRESDLFRARLDGLALF